MNQFKTVSAQPNPRQIRWLTICIGLVLVPINNYWVFASFTMGARFTYDNVAVLQCDLYYYTVSDIELRSLSIFSVLRTDSGGIADPVHYVVCGFSHLWS